MKPLAISLIAAIAFAAVQSAAASDTATYKEKVLYSFCNKQDCLDGWSPSPSVININGTLYGTTALGGNFNAGAVFAINRKTGAETLRYSFCSQVRNACPDGALPEAGLIDVKGTLYGTTFADGGHDAGTVFSIDPVNGPLKRLYAFGGGTDGRGSQSSLVALDGQLYGTTYLGGGTGCGGSGCGTVFSVDRKTGKENVLHSFSGGSDGENPLAGLIAVNGILYGTTSAGGNCDYDFCGTVFSLDPDTGTETVLYAFCSQQNCADGSDPEGNLTYLNGLLYGTTVGGGSGCTHLSPEGCGTVFSLDPASGTLTVLYEFQDGSDGGEPGAGLTIVNGELYGTTGLGGGQGIDYCGFGGCGTVFSLDPATGTETVLYAFCSVPDCADGSSPKTNLIAVHGVLYGTTQDGGASGAYGAGTVFELRAKR